MHSMRTFKWLLIGLTLAFPAHPQTITTVGGNTSWGGAYQTSLDAEGNFYAADFDRHVVYKVDRLGATTVIAGTLNSAGNTGDGGLATNAKLNNPLGTAVGADGTIYIADYSNDKIRKIAPNGIITTFAGTGIGGYTGDGGQAINARMNGPFTLLLDSKGVLYFVDYSNLRVRRIGVDGVITTVAGSGRAGNAGEGSLATAADLFPGWMAFGPDGSLYVTDDGTINNGVAKKVRKISPSGTITTVAGNGTAGFSGDGGPATSAQLVSAEGVVLDSAGNVYISEYNGARIRKVAPNGVITTYAGGNGGGSAGDGGPAIRAQLNGPSGLIVDSQDNIYVNDSVNRKIRKIAPVPNPAIRTANSVLTSFLGNAGFTSNTYVEIYGSSLSNTTRLWAGADFRGSNAPTSLDGVSVTVNGKPAFVYYISPGQININTPEDTATGPVQIQVTTPVGTSNAVTVNRSRVSPTLQSVTQFNIGGKQYVVAQTPDFRSFIGNPNMLPGVAFTRANPGQTVIIYALGCGPTNPASPAGVIAAQNSPLALPFEIKIGGVPATVSSAVLAANTIGLYQFNVVIPAVGAGDQPIELTIDGVSNNQNLVIAIGQ